MLGALSKLASINNRSSTHLREILENLDIHSGNAVSAVSAATRGNAYFAAFDPEYACLRLPPLTVRFFQDAVKFNVISNAEAQQISFQMALCCRALRQEYNGIFKEILDTGVFRDFLLPDMSLNDFLRMESVYGWCADAFAASSLWPVLPDIHLRTAGYRPITLSRSNILTHASGSYLHFINAVDIAIFGAWTGFSVKDVSQALSWLMQPTSKVDPDDIVLWPNRAADRLIIPLFSSGFQGVVFGFFAGLSSDQKEQVLKTVLHFGQSIADNYAFLRRNECLEILRKSRDAKSVAGALLRVVSPIEHLVVEVNGRFNSYSLELEDGYWAGYSEQKGHAAAELGRQLAFEDKSMKLDQSFLGESFRVILKPLQDYTALDPVFTWLSLQARLSEVLHVCDQAQNCDPLTLSMLTSLKEGLESRTWLPGEGGRGHGSLGRLKRLCIVELIIENFERGQAELTNHILKSRLVRKLGPSAPIKLNGYQIAGRALERVKNEFSDDFRRSVKFEAVGANKVRLSWFTK